LSSIRSNEQAACPCGANVPYGDCCGRFVDGGGIPETAEQLMRSRYTAYVRRAARYLLETWHVSSRPSHLELDEPVRWLGLRVVGTRAGGPQDTRGQVTFVARYRVGGTPARRLEETSRFVRESGRWYYLGAAEDVPGDTT
jgi:SEC-C motif-containing protein